MICPLSRTSTNSQSRFVLVMVRAWDRRPGFKEALSLFKILWSVPTKELVGSWIGGLVCRLPWAMNWTTFHSSCSSLDTTLKPWGGGIVFTYIWYWCQVDKSVITWVLLPPPTWRYGKHLLAFNLLAITCSPRFFRNNGQWLRSHSHIF